MTHMLHDVPSGGGVVVHDVTINIGDKTLLENINFVAQPGVVTGLIGPNGAGKSTLLAAIAGDLPVARGSITVAGHNPSTSTPRTLSQARAVMLQDVGVSFQFFVRDIVAMGRRPWKGTPAEAHDPQIIDAALAAVDCTHLEARDIVTLSGGERARVALARVLAQNTPVVLLDEPTAALDIKHQERVLSLVRTLAHEAGVTVIVVVHDLGAAAAYCDNIVCLADRTVAAAGTVEEVFTDQTLTDIYGWPIHVGRADGAVTVHPTRRHVDESAYALLRTLPGNFLGEHHA